MGKPKKTLAISQCLKTKEKQKKKRIWKIWSNWAYGLKSNPMVSTFFTLVELLVVISIIILLISILLPALKNARNTAYAIVCANRLKEIGITLNYYDNDSSGWFPTVGSHANGWGRFLRSTDYIGVNECLYDGMWYYPKRFGCPVAEKYSLSENGYRISYRLYGMNGQKPLYYNDDKYIRTDEFLRLSRIRDGATYAYLGDSIRTDDSRPLSDYCTFYNTIDGRYRLCLRHNKKANVWFLDGHIGRLGASDMSSRINITSIYYIP
ncbi:MAG: hypothetical protein A2017_05290 [Lentisphaerae bacterium GWF2_44_16]|nr:MAG: hypothetical protein A2017_05290 [Lentisphaerae bacterium GWF2_44_16]